MAKKQFDDVVTQLTRSPLVRERATGMRELLGSEIPKNAWKDVNNSSTAQAQPSVEDKIGTLEKPVRAGQPALTKFSAQPEPLNEVQQYTNLAAEPINPSMHTTTEVLPANETVIRDGFTMPKADYKLIHDLLVRAIVSVKRPINKSEILRAALHSLRQTSEPEFIQIINGVQRMKPGRKV